MSAAGIISAFNKGISGGGFGPVVAGSLVIVGQEAKAAVATTVAAEVPVCVAGFLTYLVAQGQSNDVVRWDLTLVLCVGAGVAGTLGPWATRYLAKWRMHLVLGVFIAVLGIWTIVKSWG
jgi:uncharacterized membrane protein YfcA